MDIKQIIKNFFNSFITTREEYNFTEGKKLVESLISRFEPEEQTEILYQTHVELLKKRKLQIAEAEEKVIRLKNDYDRLESIFIIK